MTINRRRVDVLLITVKLVLLMWEEFRVAKDRNIEHFTQNAVQGSFITKLYCQPRNLFFPVSEFNASSSLSYKIGTRTCAS